MISDRLYCPKTKFSSFFFVLVVVEAVVVEAVAIARWFVLSAG